MSHFTVMVICPAGTTTDNHSARVTELMAPYDENHDVAWVPDEDSEGGGYWNNPDGHWDYWVVGGRWRGYFPVAPGLTTAELDQLLVTDGRPNRMTGAHDGFDPQKREGRADGGPKRCLGFDKLRDQRGREAIQEWNDYAVAVRGTEQPMYWADFVARADAAAEEAALTLGSSRQGLLERCHRETSQELGVKRCDENGWPKDLEEDAYKAWKALNDVKWAGYEARWDAACTYSIADARHDYHAQPRVQAVRQSQTFKDRFESPVDDIDPYTREEYEQRARAAAVPTFAVVMPDGTWCAPGRMGWFGTSSDSDDDRQNFADRMNTYLDTLPDDTFIVVVDCHV